MIINVSPHIRSKNTTRRIMLDVIIALTPALLAGIYHYGWRALIVTAVSVAACVLFEFLYELILKKPVTIFDLSAVVTGLLVAFNVPSTMPIWQVIIGDLAAIILAKMLFGGIGKNFMNPALVGRIVMMFSFTTAMTTFAAPVRTFTGLFGIGADAVSSATPLQDTAQLSVNNLWGLLLGDYAGTIGETSTVLIVLGGVYLMIRKVIKPTIPVCYIASTLLFSFLFGGTEPLLSLAAGGLALGAFFMATDYATSPITNWGRVIYAVFLGLVNAVIRVFGNYAEGVTFAIILGNILVPFINEWTRPRPIGAAKAPKKVKKEAEK